MTKVFNVGVLGAANIARTKMIPAMAKADGCRFWGVASRSLAKAVAYAQEVGGGEAVEGYDALIDHPDVDVVYNALPNDLHVPYALKAIAAGKHMLCEKPIALTVAETKVLRDAAAKVPGVGVMEAFMYRFHPQWQQVLEWVEGGFIGDLRSISAQFCYFNDDPDNIRNTPSAGGGALMDVGCYGISVARMVSGQEPERVVAASDMHPEYGVDNGMHLLISLPGGVSATVMVHTKAQRSQSVMIEGSKGRIVMSHPFYSEPDEDRTVSLITDDSEQDISYGGSIDHYQLMVESFVQAIAAGTEMPLGLDDSIANMAVIEAAFASAKQGSWAAVEV